VIAGFIVLLGVTIFCVLELWRSRAEVKRLQEARIRDINQIMDLQDEVVGLKRAALKQVPIFNLQGGVKL
jgi:hypothetical protein